MRVTGDITLEMMGENHMTRILDGWRELAIPWRLKDGSWSANWKRMDRCTEKDFDEIEEFFACKKAIENFKAHYQDTCIDFMHMILSDLKTKFIGGKEIPLDEFKILITKN